MSISKTVIATACACAALGQGVVAAELSDMLKAIGRAAKQTEQQRQQQSNPAAAPPAAAPATTMDTAAPAPATVTLPAAPRTQAAATAPSLVVAPAQAAHDSTPPADEAAAVFAMAKAEGKSDIDARLYGALLPTLKQLYATAQLQSTNVAFKQLKLGADFTQKFEGSAGAGREVTWLMDDEADASKRRTASPVLPEEWKCWRETWSMNAGCRLVGAGELGTAFGETLTDVSVLLAMPTWGYDPATKLWQRAQPPRIVSIDLEAAGGSGQFLASARTYFDGLYKTTPKVTHSRLDNSLTPTRASCAAVTAKRVADLTTDDLKLRRACENPTTGLFQALEANFTSYEYVGAGGTVVLQDNKLVDGSTLVRVRIVNAKYMEERGQVPKRVEQLRAGEATRKAKGVQKDF